MNWCYLQICPYSFSISEISYNHRKKSILTQLNWWSCSFFSDNNRQYIACIKCEVTWGGYDETHWEWLFSIVLGHFINSRKVFATNLRVNFQSNVQIDPLSDLWQVTQKLRLIEGILLTAGNSCSFLLWGTPSFEDACQGQSWQSIFWPVCLLILFYTRKVIENIFTQHIRL